jgi:hypothetical protein
VSTILDIAQKLSGVSLGTLLLVILWGSYRGIWTWGRDLEAMKQERDVIRAALEADRNDWRRIALQHTGLIEKAVDRASRPVGSVGPGGSESA